MILVPSARGVLAGRSGPVDPYFASVVALLYFDGTNGSTMITNSCPRGSTFSVFGGSTALSTTSPQTGTACADIIHTSGGNGRIISTSADYAFGDGLGGIAYDYTIEMSYWQTAQADSYMFDIGDSSPFGHNRFDPDFYGSGRAAWEMELGGVTASDAAATTTLNAWNTIAFSRTGLTGYAHFNGVYVNGLTFTPGFGTSYVGTNITLGTSITGGFPATCRFDNFRLTIGVGRYGAANYTPTFPFPDH